MSSTTPISKTELQSAYLVNKSLQAAGMSANNVCRRDCPKNEHLTEKQRFEGKWEVLRTISQSRTSLADM